MKTPGDTGESTELYLFFIYCLYRVFVCLSSGWKNSSFSLSAASCVSTLRAPGRKWQNDGAGLDHASTQTRSVPGHTHHAVPATFTTLFHRVLTLVWVRARVQWPPGCRSHIRDPGWCNKSTNMQLNEPQEKVWLCLNVKNKDSRRSLDI